jgi:hypothetical protein
MAANSILRFTFCQSWNTLAFCPFHAQEYGRIVCEARLDRAAQGRDCRMPGLRNAAATAAVTWPVTSAVRAVTAAITFQRSTTAPF